MTLRNLEDAKNWIALTTEIALEEDMDCMTMMMMMMTMMMMMMMMMMMIERLKTTYSNNTRNHALII